VEADRAHADVQLGSDLRVGASLGDRLATFLGCPRPVRPDSLPGFAQRFLPALDVYRELGDRLGQANARTLLAEVRRLTGDYESAARDLEESIGYREAG
jgi:hypothetical protein